jgi:hypothetical protein
MPPFTTLNGQTGYFDNNGQFIPATQEEYNKQFAMLQQFGGNPFLNAAQQSPLNNQRTSFVQQGTIQSPETATETNEQKVMQAQGDDDPILGVGNMPYVKMGNEYGVKRGKSFFGFDAMTAGGHPLNTATNTVYNTGDLTTFRKQKIANPFVAEVALIKSQNTQNALNALNNPTAPEITPTTTAQQTNRGNFFNNMFNKASDQVIAGANEVANSSGSFQDSYDTMSGKLGKIGAGGGFKMDAKKAFTGTPTTSLIGGGINAVSKLIGANAGNYDERVGMTKPNLGGTLLGDATFTQMGSMFGPAGMAIGGTVDLVKNAIKYVKQKDKYENKKLATDTMQSIDDARENMKPDYTGYARFGTQVKNPYIKQYNPGGKVIVDGKEISTSSKEYKNLYDAGVLMGIDSDGLPSMYAPEVEITAKMTDEERERRLRKQYYDPNLTERENEKKYQAKKQIESWKQADINQPGGLQNVSEMMSYPFKVAAGSTPEMLEAKRQQEEERRLQEEYWSPEKQRERAEEKKAKDNKELDDRLNSAMIMDRYINEPLGEGTFPFQMRSLGNGLGGHNLWESLHLGAGMYYQNPQKNTQNPYAWLAGGLGGPKLVDENDPQSIYFIKKDLSKQKEYPFDLPIMYNDPNYPHDWNINERNFIYDEILSKGYNYQPLDDNGFVHRNFTPEKDTLLGGIYIDPATLQKLAERYDYNDVELKKAIMRYAKINEDRITNDINNVYIHTNTIPPDAYETYRNLKSKNNKLVYNWNEMYKDEKGGTVVGGAPDPKYFKYPKNANGGMVQNPYLKSRFGMETDPIKKKANETDVADDASLESAGPESDDLGMISQKAYNTMQSIYNSKGYEKKLANELKQSNKMSGDDLLVYKNPFAPELQQTKWEVYRNNIDNYYSGKPLLDRRKESLDADISYMDENDPSYETAWGYYKPDLKSDNNIGDKVKTVHQINPYIKIRKDNDHKYYTLIEELEHASHYPAKGTAYGSESFHPSGQNITPYAQKILKENINVNYEDSDYLTMLTEAIAKKRATEAYLIENNLLKPGENVNESHYKFLEDNYTKLPNNVRHMMQLTDTKPENYNIKDFNMRPKALLKQRKKDQTKSFLNIMNKIAMQQNSSSNESLS